MACLLDRRRDRELGAGTVAGRASRASASRTAPGRVATSTITPYTSPRSHLVARPARPRRTPMRRHLRADPSRRCSSGPPRPAGRCSASGSSSPTTRARRRCAPRPGRRRRARRRRRVEASTMPGQSPRPSRPRRTSSDAGAHEPGDSRQAHPDQHPRPATTAASSGRDGRHGPAHRRRQRPAAPTVSDDLDDLAGRPFPHDGTQAAASVAGVDARGATPRWTSPSTPPGSVAVEELRPVVGRDRGRQRYGDAEAAGDQASTASAADRRRAARSAAASGERPGVDRAGPRRANGPVPTRQTSTARIAAPPTRRTQPPRSGSSRDRHARPCGTPRPSADAATIRAAVVVPAGQTSGGVRGPPSAATARRPGVVEPATAAPRRARSGSPGGTSSPGRVPSGPRPSASGTPPTPVAITGSPRASASVTTIP